jgi:ABC-type histidine transport system ATPase subunit
MDAGEIIESGPPNTILKSPKTERLKLFLEKLSLTSL